MDAVEAGGRRRRCRGSGGRQECGDGRWFWRSGLQAGRQWRRSRRRRRKADASVRWRRRPNVGGARRRPRRGRGREARGGRRRPGGQPRRGRHGSPAVGVPLYRMQAGTGK
uniref:Uncharacterized protein n=1 Tax=Zea mays TaxID=4577 RepID=C0PLB4_MAIZE|nr:unknown [Zea mays]